MVETPRTEKDEWAFEGKPNGPSAQVGETERPSVIKGSRMTVRYRAGDFFAKPGGTAGMKTHSSLSQRKILGQGFFYALPDKKRKEKPP